MYRFFKPQSLKTVSGYTSETTLIRSTKMKLCSYCRVYHLITPKQISYTQSRNQTTIPALSLLTKKSKHASKRFTELLEVGDGTISNRRAAIRKMNPTQLSLFVNNGNTPIDNIDGIHRDNLLELKQTRDVNDEFPSHITTLSLHENKPELSSYILEETDNPMKKIDHGTVMEDLETSGISDPAFLIKSTSFLNSIAKEDSVHDELDEETETTANTVVDSSKKKKSQSKAKKVSVDVAEIERSKLVQLAAKKESIIRTLTAYLRVCVSCGMIGRAFHTIMHYRITRISKGQLAIKDIKLYNILLQAYADNGNIVKLEEIMQFIKVDKIEPSAETYAIIYECYGNYRGDKNNVEALYKWYDDMKRQSITLNDILNESKLKFGKYETVLRMIQLVEPEFVPEKIIRDHSYQNHMLDKIKPEGAVCESPAKDLLTLQDIQDRYKIQVQNEIAGCVKIPSIEKFDSTKPIVTFYRKLLVDLENDWQIAISEAFDRDLKALKNREYKPIPNAIVLYPCLCVLDKSEYVDAILREIRHLATGSETFSPTFSMLCRRLGKHINEKYEMLVNKQNGIIDVTAKVYDKYAHWYIHRDKEMNARVIWQRLSDEISPNFSLDSQILPWPHNLQLSVGKFLYGIILKDVKIDVNHMKSEASVKHFSPAFYTLFRSVNSKHLVEEIKPHPMLSKVYRESQPPTLDFDTALVPSVCPPRPWSSIQSGGFILLKSDVIRMPLHAAQQMKRLQSTSPTQLWPSLDSLNQLSSIPWTVNNAIVDLVIKIFRDGGSTDLNVPQPPSILGPVPLLQADSSEDDRKAIMKARRELKRKKSEMYSLWCDALYRLSLANHFRNKIFWLPHNMDFRGRVYPMPPHLNHLGSDLARSMLMFALGKPLGPNGLNWLKIHVINLTGLKKRESISERLRYANEISDKILDSAERPLTGKMWWAKSEEPWQTLAGCMEIAAALKAPNPEEYICHFPIHQDGSCNGLQHYAALGRDQMGAENVNLHPSDTPQDVYSSVAAMVDKTRHEDAENGDKVAKALAGFVKRKVIKQTVMTTVYGVTKFGARLQIARQLKDIERFPQEHVWAASLYLTQKTFDSLRTMFASAKLIQDWFTDCARIIATLKGQNIEWITPLGLPVVQPYSKVIASKQGFTDVYTDSLEKPNTIKQKNAFAPNFIHSLDSCHMMLTSLHCENEALTFVSVHDCFWTHPSTVEPMNRICRDQFVALHSEPILENLSKFFIQRYISENDNAGDGSLGTSLSQRKILHAVTKIPPKGKFDLKNVLNSTYFFS